MVPAASGERFPVSVALGADPATILGAVTPVPDTLSEYAFAGLLRGTKTEVVKCVSNDLEVPASAEIVLEGYLEPGDMAPEGPTATIPAITMKWMISRYLPLLILRSAVMRSIILPTPAVRRMNPRCSVWR